jgi:hypothetical protein
MMRAATAAGIAIDNRAERVSDTPSVTPWLDRDDSPRLAVMLGLRAGLEWTLETASDAYDGLGEALGSLPGGPGLADIFDDFLDTVGLLGRTRPLGAPDLQQRSPRRWRSADHQPMRQNNARPIEAGDIETVARTVMGAWPP